MNVDADPDRDTIAGPTVRALLRRRLRQAARQVASTRTGLGQRRQVLNRIAFELGGYLHYRDLITVEQIARRLFAAARVNGMAQEEPERTRRTIADGLRDGARNPLFLDEEDGLGPVGDDRGPSESEPAEDEEAAGQATAGPPAPPGRREAFDDPDRLARIFLDRLRQAGEGLVRWRQQFYAWHPDRPSYAPRSEEEIRASVRRAIREEFDRHHEESARRAARERKATPTAPKVTPQRLNATLDAIRSLVLIPGDRDAPSWIGDDPSRPDPRLVLPVRNGLLDLSGLRVDDDGTVDHSSIRLMESTPDFFSLHHLPYAYDPEAWPPERWFSFLAEVFPGDASSIRELRKWFGYLMRPDTSLQAILMLIGLSRSGKGTIARVLRRLLGEANVASPALTELAGDHGLQDLVGKSVILFSDARLGGDGAKLAMAQERLLKISGEDPVRINPKYREAYTTTLPGRIVILSNEMPGLRDSSHAFVNRARPLKFGVSFAGREDRTLTGEGGNVGQLDNPDALAGIANWALGGIGLLRADGGFRVPETARPLIATLREASVPLQSFVDDWLDTSDPEHLVQTPLLYAAYLHWRSESGVSSRLATNNVVKQLGAICPTIGGCGDQSRILDAVLNRRLRQVKGVRLIRQPGAKFREEAGYPRTSS